MKEIINKEINKIEKFKEKISSNRYYDYVDEKESDFRKLNWDTQSFCKTIVLKIQDKIPSYYSYIMTSDEIFLDDLSYSENRITYGEDMNLFSDSSPSEILNRVTRILKHMVDNINE
ncbi:hypothetical protein CRU99_00945 [Malaciobacter mytili]|uniref:hypothetical protein n=1 Tax=Malaciobacter mytili TaxID=603050 RepID=UPI00100A8CE3|nr:hypothetical protein [Malaciobacter mytili]RXI48391.1 hypothetical protein CRU99_00945 [Malaciobacter mytili]